MTKQTELSNLIEELQKHDEHYAKGAPIISDTEYDELYFKARDLANEGFDDGGFFKDHLANDMIINDNKENSLDRIKHTKMMRSLDKAHTEQDIKDFLSKFSGDPTSPVYTDSFVVELKEDGLTVVMYFNDDSMDSNFKAVTRGGGIEGVDVTETFRPYEKILNELDGNNLVVRGEAVVNDQNFDMLQNEYPGVYNSKRNAAPGIVGRKGIEQTLANAISFYAYEIENELIRIETQEEQLMLLDKLGFETTHLKKFFTNDSEGRQQIEDFIVNEFDEQARSKVGHIIDGLVIKPNVRKTIEALGVEVHHPNNMIAFKFAAEEAIAILDKVIWQESGNGRLTPVGVLDHPVELAGAMIQRASLASIQNIEERDLMLHDHVVIRRSNDVIPQITGSIKEARDGSEERIQIPEGSYRVGALVKTNQLSRGALLQQWAKMTDKAHLDIDGFSGRTIEFLDEAELIDLDDFSSLWNINEDDFIKIDGLGKKSYNKLQDSLEKAKNAGLRRIMLSLPIDALGNFIIDKLLEWHDDWSDIIESDNIDEYKYDFENFINGTKGFGKSKIDIALQIFNEKNMTILRNLKHVGLIMKSNDEKQKIESEALSDLRIVITGKLENITRKDLEKLIIENGGTVQKKVDKDTTFLINNNPESSSSKNKTAKELGIKIISEDEAMNLINSKLGK